MTNTSKRLRLYMELFNLKQVDIVEMCQPYANYFHIPITKGMVSRWVSGATEPRQNKLYILGRALNVEETWLMGYDVPMERSKRDESPIDKLLNSEDVPTQKKDLLLQKVSSLDDEQAALILRVLELPLDKLKALNKLLEAIG